MKQCWKEMPDDRPTFRELTTDISAMLVAPANKKQKKRDKYYNITEVDAYQTGKKSTPKKEKASGSKSN